MPYFHTRFTFDGKYVLLTGKCGWGFSIVLRQIGYLRAHALSKRGELSGKGGKSKRKRAGRADYAPECRRFSIRLGKGCLNPSSMRLKRCLLQLGRDPAASQTLEALGAAEALKSPPSVRGAARSRPTRQSGVSR